MIILAEKISTNLKINFENEYKIASLFKAPIIVDIGAHLGESIKAFKKYSPKSKIISFEPNKKLFNRIKKFNDENTKIFNYAISNKKINYLYIPKIFGFQLSLWSTFSIEYLQKRWSDFSSFFVNIIDLFRRKVR